MSSSHAKRSIRLSEGLAKLASFVHRNGDVWLLEQPAPYSNIKRVVATRETISNMQIVAWSARGWIVRRFVDQRTNRQSWELSESGREALGGLE